MVLWEDVGKLKEGQDSKLSSVMVQVLLWRRALNFVNWKRWGNNEYEGHHYIL